MAIGSRLNVRVGLCRYNVSRMARHMREVSDGDTIKVTNPVLFEMIFGKEKPISIRID